MPMPRDLAKWLLRLQQAASQPPNVALADHSSDAAAQGNEQHDEEE